MSLNQARRQAKPVDDAWFESPVLRVDGCAGRAEVVAVHAPGLNGRGSFWHAAWRLRATS